jgi:hypothetical protein
MKYLIFRKKAMIIPNQSTKLPRGKKERSQVIQADKIGY